MGVSEKLWNGTSELFQVVYSSATAVHMLSGEAYVRALRAHFLVQSALAPIILQFISPLSLLNSYQHTMLKENIYVILVTQMINSFQMKYQSMLIQMTLRSYIH